MVCQPVTSIALPLDQLLVCSSGGSLLTQESG